MIYQFDFFVLFGFNAINLGSTRREITSVKNGMHNWNCIWNYSDRTLITLTTGSLNRGFHVAFQIHLMEWEMVWILGELAWNSLMVIQLNHCFCRDGGVEHLFKRHCMCVTSSLGGGFSPPRGLILSSKIHTLNRHSVLCKPGDGFQRTLIPLKLVINITDVLS